jgi:hypothetical protein
VVSGQEIPRVLTAVAIVGISKRLGDTRQLGEEKMSASTPDEETTLHYIDKLLAGSSSMGSRAFRLLLTQVALSFILLALSAGIVATAKGVFTFQGVGLRVSLAPFLAGGALFVGGCVVAGDFYARRATMVHGVVRRLYKSIGYEDETLDDPRFFGLPFVKRSRAELLFGNTVSLLLPTAAQVAAGFKVADLLQYKGPGWTWILFVLLAFGTAWTVLLVNLRSTLELLRLYKQPVEGPIPLLRPLVLMSRWPLLGTLVAVFVTKLLGSS